MSIKEIINWSEVWAILIPLIVLIWKRNNESYLRPVKIYIIAAFTLNLAIDVIAETKGSWGIDATNFFWNNNVFYNISSIVRLLLFSWFFILLNQRFMHRIKALIPFGFLIFVLINFIFFEKFIPQGDDESFSSRLLATEAALLLFYCLQYFIYLMLEDRGVTITKEKGFWVITGLTIYVATSFFIFLFYDYLSRVTRDFAVGIWDIHNIAFIIFCLCMAKQFYNKNE
jgi:hypothetical protein